MSESEEEDIITERPIILVSGSSAEDAPETAYNSRRKRSHSHDENGSSVNPTKKLRIKSSISIGLEKGEADDGKKPGLFQYFRKASKEDQKEYDARTTEELKEQMDKVLLEERKAKRAEKLKIRGRNRERKRRQRGRKVNLEIESGLRSPGGTKRRQVRHTFYKFFINSLATYYSCNLAT